MVEPMSPRLASASTSTPASRSACDRAFQHRVSRRAVRLEERHLRFDDREVGERLHADLAEPRQPVGVDRQPPRAQQFGMRVDAGAQRPAPRYRVGQPAHRNRHVYGPSTLCSSCSDITPMSPRMPASMPCTAAEAPCTVVTHGMFIATAAERIS